MLLIRGTSFWNQPQIFEKKIHFSPSLSRKPLDCFALLITHHHCCRGILQIPSVSFPPQWGGSVPTVSRRGWVRLGQSLVLSIRRRLARREARAVRATPAQWTAAATTAAVSFPPYSLFLSSSSAALRRHSRIPSATRSSAISSGRQSLLGSHGEPLSGGALGAPRHDVRGERQEGLPSHPPKRTNGADRRSDHSSNTKYNNEHSRQLAHRAKRREKRTQRPVKTTSSIFCGAP